MNSQYGRYSYPIEYDMLPEDVNEHREVFLFIYGPRSADISSYDLHWSISWKVTPNAWRHIFLELYANYDTGPTPIMRYVYAGAETTLVTDAMQDARKCSLGRMSPMQRWQIEDLARQVGLCEPSSMWSCRNWIRGLLSKMADSGIIPQRVREDALEYAATGWKDVIPVR